MIVKQIEPDLYDSLLGVDSSDRMSRKIGESTELVDIVIAKHVQPELYYSLLGGRFERSKASRNKKKYRIG